MEVVENIEQFGILPKIRAFTTKQALSALSVKFFSDYECRGWIIKNLHPEGAFCPGCRKEILDETTLSNYWNGRRCKCKSCGKWFSAFSGTFLQECQMDERKIFILAILTELNLHKNEIARILDINPATVRIWQGKFKALNQIKITILETDNGRD